MTPDAPVTKKDIEDHVTNHDLSLELKNVRSEVRLWIVIAIIANQTLSHVELPPEVGYPAAVLAIAIAAGKSFLLRF